MSVLIDLISFSIFIVLQSLFINGVHESFRGGCVNDMNKGEVCEGMILYPIRKFLSKYISEYWQKPLWGCIKCGSSIGSIITFWPTVLIVYGFHWEQVLLWIFDIFILVPLNYIIYKQI